MNILEDGLSFFMRALKASRHYGAVDRGKQDVINGAIERVIDNTDTKIRLIVGYRRKLRHAIESSFEYIDALVDGIPGALVVNRRSFIEDPQVNSFFVNVEDLQHKFSRSPEVREFIEADRDRELKDIFSLLCMEKREKTIYGVELNGEIMRRDVPQIGVSFTDHQMLSPASTEAEARRGLKDCMFQGLTTYALGRLRYFQTKREAFEDQGRRLRVRLNSLRTKARRSDSEIESVRIEIRELERRLAENERSLSEIKSELDTTDDALEQVNEVIGHPDQVIKYERVHMKINKLGVKLKEDSHEPANEIDLAEITFGDSPSRVVVLTKYPRSDILPKEDFLKKASLYLTR
ncbi:MAG: hypothetical protein ABFS45_12250 [Pseudomonadota bacterium]